jgi:hypothetical protein
VSTTAISTPVQQSNLVHRLTEDGEVESVEITPEEQQQYTFKADGMYNLLITGVYDPWTQPKKAEWIKPGGPTEDTLTRIEFEIVDGKGAGKRFASRVTVSLGSRSNLIHLWKSTVGPVGTNPDLTDLLGHKVTMFVSKNDVVNESTGQINTYANPNWNTAKPFGKAANDDGWED